MVEINPLSGNLAQSAQLQFQQSAEKTKQARREKELARNVAARDDEMEHQVENSEELTEIHEKERQAERRRKQQQHRQDEDESAGAAPARLDLTA